MPSESGLCIEVGNGLVLPWHCLGICIGMSYVYVLLQNIAIRLSMFFSIGNDIGIGIRMSIRISVICLDLSINQDLGNLASIFMLCQKRMAFALALAVSWHWHSVGIGIGISYMYIIV